MIVNARKKRGARAIFLLVMAVTIANCRHFFPFLPVRDHQS
jgi:hypothetical protein